jgi:magnesium-protoporphyrin O-methyltransferase
MSCSQCQGIEDFFSEAFVAKELHRYRRQGPDKTTRMLTDALKGSGVHSLTLLDIGGGLGAIQHEMFAAGVESATDIDASAAYIAAARAESERRGFAERVSYKHGNFVDMAEHLPAADIVTLDRVICCYPGMEKMVRLSAARARKYYGLVYPRDTWWMRAGIAIENLFYRIQRNPYRAYIHATEAVEALIMGEGLKRRFHKRTLAWQVALFAR